MMDIEKDLKYLSETDEPYAKLKASTESIKDAIKHTKGKFISESSLSVSKAENEFYASQQYLDAIKLLKEGNENVFAMRNKRATAILRIDVWRTLEASRRKGNIQ